MNEDKRLTIMSWDPGGTTGWAALSIYLRHIATLATYGLDALGSEILLIRSGQLSGSELRQTDAAYALVQAGVDRGESDYVLFLYEDFILRKRLKSRALLSPVRMTSRLQALNSFHWQFHELKQQPSLAKTATPDKMLKKYNLYTPGKPHANDAKRHAITLVRRFAAKPGFLNQCIKSSKELR
jgi:hypothetical protein